MKIFLSAALLLCLLCVFAVGCTTDKSGVDSAENIGIDVDLTVMSGTMVYSTVINMLESPNDYMGQTIIASGSYYVEYFEGTEKHYHYMIIESAIGCCPQGLEFVLGGENDYPDDYPAENDLIEITGVFSSYEELGETWYYLAVSPDKLFVRGSEV